MSVKSVTLRARWHGDHPAIGDYLMARLRPRNAYRIVAIQQRPKILELTCHRVKPTEVPEGATVHDWKWDPRTKEGAAWAS